MIWNFDPEIAMTPTTEAGKAHAEAWIDAVDIEWGLEPADRETMLGMVAAIETEAVAAERTRIAEAVRELHVNEAFGGVEIVDVLAIVNPEETDHD